MNASEQQATKLVAVLVEHNKLFTRAPMDQVQWAIQNPAAAIEVFCSALGRKAEIANKPELIIDPIIRVDRSVRPAYPGWVKNFLHPELQGTGPIEYDVSRVEQWLHDGQRNNTIKGQKIYEYLKEKKMLQSCLGLSDLVAIQAKGIVFFRQHFAGKAIFGWKSVVRDRGDLSAPCLCGHGGEVVLCWDWLEDDWHGCSPALRFAS